MTAFCLRPWQETDAVSLVRYADDPGIAANLRDVFPSPYTRPDADNFIRDCLEREGRDQLSRAVVIGGQAVGCITVTRGRMCIAETASWATGWDGLSGAGA
ncbi:MAG: hypothetical protein V8R40_03770 [Dysosmobacter sp.]